MAAALSRRNWQDKDWLNQAQQMDALLRKSLLLAPCSSALVENDKHYTNIKTEKCHVLPDSTRTITYAYSERYDGGKRHGTDPHLSASVTLGKGNAAQGFVRQMKEEAARKRKESALKDFAAGK